MISSKPDHDQSLTFAAFALKEDRNLGGGGAKELLLTHSLAQSLSKTTASFLHALAANFSSLMASRMLFRSRHAKYESRASQHRLRSVRSGARAPERTCSARCCSGLDEAKGLEKRPILEASQRERSPLDMRLETKRKSGVSWAEKGICRGGCVVVNRVRSRRRRRGVPSRNRWWMMSLPAEFFRRSIALLPCTPYCTCTIQVPLL